jgi:hypothetical protein
MSDQVTFSGDGGSGSGTLILTFNQITTASSGMVVFSAPGLADNNPYQGGNFSANPSIGSPYVWPGSGQCAEYPQGWSAERCAIEQRRAPTLKL